MSWGRDREREDEPAQGLKALLRSLLPGVPWAERAEIWTTITPTSEYESVDPAGAIIRVVGIGRGETWTLQSGILLYGPAMVCHLWTNDATGTPVHIPWVGWGQNAYVALPAGLSVSGPVWFYFWCVAPGRQAPEPIFYSLDWRVRP